MIGALRLGDLGANSALEVIGEVLATPHGGLVSVTGQGLLMHAATLTRYIATWLGVGFELRLLGPHYQEPCRRSHSSSIVVRFATTTPAGIAAATTTASTSSGPVHESVAPCSSPMPTGNSATIA